MMENLSHANNWQNTFAQQIEQYQRWYQEGLQECRATLQDLRDALISAAGDACGLEEEASVCYALWQQRQAEQCIEVLGNLLTSEPVVHLLQRSLSLGSESPSGRIEGTRGQDECCICHR